MAEADGKSTVFNGKESAREEPTTDHELLGAHR